MEWVKLTSNYYNDPAIMRAGEAAEILFTRAMGYCGEQETDGYVPAEVLDRLTPTRGRARAAALVREGLWHVVDGGWQFTAWDRRQTTSDQLNAHREANRRRQAAHRTRRKSVSNGARNGVTNAEVTPTEVEEELDNAAAAALHPTPPLPPAVEILKGKLDARKLTARWDKLTADQLSRIEALVERHGDGPLIASALASFRPDSPAAFAQAWLSAWEALPAPGTLTLVRRLCDAHGTTLTDSGTCTSCEADRKAGDR